MKVIIAPDSFKGGLDAATAATTIFKAFKEVKPNYNYILKPISDGGEGILKALANKTLPVMVTGPLGKLTSAEIGFLKDEKTIIIEMALAAGFEKVEEDKRDANYTTTYGVGELLLKALECNPKRIIIGLGGSATNDLGIGALQALGIKFYDENNDEVGIFGKDIFKIKSVDSTNVNKKLKEIDLILATDVKNPLLGERGSTFVYGPQKGLKEKDLKKYDEQFKIVSELLNKEFNRDFTNVPGVGAAGGIAYSLATVFDGKITSGFDVVYEELKLEETFKKADYLITAEGKIDSQTLSGKGPLQIALKAKETNPKIKVVIFVGTNLLKDNNIFDKIIEINDSKLSLKDNIKQTKTHLSEAAKNYFQEL